MLSTIITFSGSGASLCEACATWLRTERTVLKRDGEKLIGSSRTLQESGKSTESTSSPSGEGSAHCRTGKTVASRTDAQTAEQEKSTLIQTLGAMRQDRGGADTKGIGQPFILKGEQDFGEWTHKVRSFMLARFGDQILPALTWAARQRNIVVQACGSSQRDRFAPWIDVFGIGADEEDQIDGIDDFGGKLYAYLVSFTTDAANRIVRNSGEGNGLEAWRRLHNEYDPTSSMRRVAILQQVHNPPRCQRVEDLGTALEDWLTKKRQYEMFTDRNGRPCQTSDDSLVAAMFRLVPRSLEETVMFENEDEGFQELYDRLLACSSTKQSITMSENKTTRKDEPMDVDALSKGTSRKEKARKALPTKERAAKARTARAMSCAGTVASMDTTREAVDKSVERTKVGQKRVRKVTNMLMDGLGVMSMLMGCGKVRLADRNWFRMVDESKRLDTMGIRRTSGRN